MKAVIIPCLAALVLWTAMFGPTKACLSFWPMMTLSSGLLAVSALVLQQKNRPEPTATIPLPRVLQPIENFFAASARGGFWMDLAVGLLSPLVLYAGFYIAYHIARQLFGFAAGQVEHIYQLRDGTSPLPIALLLALWIGPAEEIFWRGFVQKRLCRCYGILVGFVAATAVYTLVHAASMNLMLIAAAALCGGFWGLLYAWRKRLWPAILSHAAWDVIIFVLYPIR